MTNRIGIRTASLGGAFAPERMRDMAAWSFSALELNFNRPRCGLDWRDRDMAGRIRAAAATHGILLTAHAPDDVWITNPDGTERRESVAVLESMLDAAARWGFTTLVIHPCGGRKVLPGRERDQTQALEDALCRLAPACAASEARLLLESSTPGTFTADWPRILSIVRRAAVPGVGVLVDTNHLNLTCDLAEGIRAAGALLGEIHANDNHGEREEHRLPYDGIIDWPGVARALVEIGFDGPVIMEPDHFRADAFPDLVTAASAHAKRFVNELASARVCANPPSRA